jgi:pilus assembly protein CpaE
VVGTAVSGNETLHLAKVHKPDIIILDINLPDVDVFKLTSNFNEFENKPVVLLLMVSHDSAVEQRALDAGAYACLAKNEGIDPLIDTIQKIRKTKVQGE